MMTTLLIQVALLYRPRPRVRLWCCLGVHTHIILCICMYNNVLESNMFYYSYGYIYIYIYYFNHILNFVMTCGYLFIFITYLFILVLGCTTELYQVILFIVCYVYI